MELMESPQETWASEPYVQQLLAYMLAMPTADHSVAVATLLDGDDLRAAQAVSLLRASNRLDFSKQKWQASVSKNKGVAYHTWMYHFLGGAPAKLLPRFLVTDLWFGVDWARVYGSVAIGGVSAHEIC